MNRIKIPASSIAKYELNLADFSGATNTIISEARLGKRGNSSKFAKESVNIWQNQDGIWETRPGMAYYGEALPADLDGATEFQRADGVRETIAIANNKVWKSINGGSWTEVTGATFTAGKTPYFLQIKGVLYISNRFDPLAVYDGSTLTKYSSLTDPVSAPSASKGSGISASGSYTTYYRYTANNTVGNTNPSPAISITTAKSRESWVESSNEYCDITLTPVPGATTYDIWAGDISGKEHYLGSTSSTSFRDYGQAINIYREAPDDNTTAAPLFGPMEMSGNRMWATYDPNNEWRVYGTGVGQYLGYFSTYYGGFWVDVEKGGKFKPINVVHYRTGKGDPIITVPCTSPDGQGTMFQIELTTITIGDVTFVVPVVYKLVGSIGFDAPLSVIKISDNVGGLNKKGVFFLRNKQQMFNVLAADDMSSPIRDRIESLNYSQIDKSCGYYKPPRAFWSVPEGSVNDTTFIFDNERRNWAYKWTCGFKMFFEYTDNTDTKVTHFIGVPAAGNKLVEISANFTDDFGEPFFQSYVSPLIPVDPTDHRVQAKVRDVIFEIGQLRGTVKVEVLGKTKKTEITSIGAETVNSTIGTSGWGDDFFSDMLFSDTGDTPSVFTSTTRKKRVKVNKKIYAIQFRVWTNEKAFWQLLSIQAFGFLLMGKPPSNWD